MSNDIFCVLHIPVERYPFDVKANGMLSWPISKSQRIDFQRRMETYDHVNCIFLEAPCLAIAWAGLISVSDRHLDLTMIVNGVNHPVPLNTAIAGNEILSLEDGDNISNSLLIAKQQYEVASSLTRQTRQLWHETYSSPENSHE